MPALLFALAALLPLTGPPPPALPTLQERAPAQGSGDVEARARELRAGFQRELQVWEQRRLKLSLGGRTPDPRALGPHPALAQAPLFQPLAEAGSPSAHVWFLEQLGALASAHDDAWQQREFGRHFEALLPAHAAHPDLFYVAAAVEVQRAVLGPEASERYLVRLEQESTQDEVRAGASWLRALLRKTGRTPPDPAALEEARELERSLVMRWPATKAGRKAAAELYRPAARAAETRLAQWVASALVAARAGQPPASWPAAPLAELALELEPLALAGHPLAERWMNTLLDQPLPADAPAAALRIARPLCFEPPDPTGDVVATGLSAYELCFRARGAEPATVALLAPFEQQVERLPFEALERVLTLLRERTPDADARRTIAWLCVRCALASGAAESYARALYWRGELERDAPDDERTRRAREACAPLEKVLVGGQAPELDALDATGARVQLSALRGRVVLLAFMNRFTGQGLESVEAWRMAAHGLAQQPFDLLVVNAGPSQAKDAAAARRAAGLRTIDLNTMQHPLLDTWMVRRYPTTLVIDAQGVVRARDLDWERTRALLSELVRAAGPPR